MAGVKGMVPAKPRRDSMRSKVWQSIRIFRRFTLPDLCRTADARINNVRKFVRRLEEHGYVAKVGGYVSGRGGSYQGWRLVKDAGPNYPTRCRRCGRPLGEPCTPKEAEHEGDSN
ncbi:MAG: hypothetical protein APR55_08145 [Methanolinea sp. SDB]|nr:MAG: hypothetical protein APR55_08145 [Methanolinea sp. SDB]